MNDKIVAIDKRINKTKEFLESLESELIDLRRELLKS